MKDMTMIVWLTQLGLSVALPLCGFVLLAVWLQNTFNWGSWVIWVGVIFGVISAAEGFRSTLKAMQRLSKDEKEDTRQDISFNDHD